MITLQVAALVVVVLVSWFVRRPEAGAPDRLTRVLASWPPLIAVFVITFVVLWYTWAQWSPMPVVHDELAYVLQAKIFARGRWTLPTPAMPLFFEQPYVLVEPAMASKYFPGHSILLSIGAVAGWVPLMPLVLQSLAACLIVVLARRVSSSGVALFTWVFWLSTTIVLYYGPSYYSEATTIVCWLAGWYALLEWWTTHRARWLVGVAVCTGWCVITRPLTGLAYAIPIAVVVLVDVLRGRRWRDLALAVAAGVLVLSIIPLWSAKTTGDWRVTPLQRYTQDYMPYDLPGFGLDSTPPARTLNPEFVHLNEVFSSLHPGHVPSALPRIFLERARYLADAIWARSHYLFAALAVLGLATLRGPSAFAVASSVLLLLVYLSFGTTPTWSLYYYESVPAYAFLTAAGAGWLAAAIGGRRLPSRSEPSSWRSERWTAALASGALVLAASVLPASKDIRRQHIGHRVHLVRFAQMRASLPAQRALLFVRHSPLHNPHETLVQNVADPQNERVLVVYDRGSVENEQLMRLMPDRTPFLFDEAGRAVYSYRGAEGP